MTMQLELADFLARWRAATGPEALFGPLTPPTPAQLKRRYRELAVAVHPDGHPAEKVAASEAFRLLHHWHDVARRMVEAGSYGLVPTLDVRTGATHYVSYEPPIAGDLCELYRVDGPTGRVLVKIPRHPRNNDLLAAEAAALEEIESRLKGEPLRAHFPTLADSFTLRDQHGAQRRCNVLCDEWGYVSAAEVQSAYTKGIEVPDMIWIFNRLLVALGVSHGLGLIHGAVLPPHLLLRLRDHNGMLIDWCYRVAPGEPVRAISPAHLPFYPPEVLEKEGATTATDLYMAASCMVALLGGEVATRTLPADVPKPIATLLRACLLPAPHRRLDDAWELFEELGHRARHLYGPPRFRPFALPTT